METTTKRNGSVIATTHWELSGDAALLRLSSTYIDLHGLPKSKESFYTRASGSRDFSGTWDSTKPFESQPSLLLMRLQGRALHYAFPEENNIPIRCSMARTRSRMVPEFRRQ